MVPGRSEFKQHRFEIKIWICRELNLNFWWFYQYDKIQELIEMCVQQQQQRMLLQKLQIMIKSVLILMIMAIQSKRNCLKVIKSKRSSFDICKSAIEHKGILRQIAWYINPHLWILGHTEAGESHQGDQISAITSDHLHSGKIGRYL